MYHQPAVLGIDAISPKIAPRIQTERMLQDLGNNTGNILFSESLYTVLKNAKRCSYHFRPQDIAGCDVIVIAAANWISPYSDFGDLAKRIEATGLPVIICGIGAQIYNGNNTPELKPGLMRLLKLASECSKAISVRGAFSCEVLNTYGIKNGVATGCPSLLLAGSKGPSLSFSGGLAPANVAIHSTRHLYNKADGFQAYLYREALRLKTELILQSELVDMFFVFGSEIEEEKAAVCDEILTTAYGQDVAVVKEYLKKHGKPLVTLTEWLAYLKTIKFCIGSRVHGTIASLLAGVPSVLIAHDTRTEELAVQMGLPYTREKDVDADTPLDYSTYYAHGKFNEFLSHYTTYRTIFADFFNAVGLPFDADYAGISV
ncbi:MAG: polysaccharide pyruvyl transferase family protein [Methylobacter sp.]